jgi:hypothetical protein
VLKPCLRYYTPPLDLLAPVSKFQHLAPTVRATKKPPAMAPKKASSKADEAAKAALLAARKGKALALTHSTHQEAAEDDALRTCGLEGQPQPPPVFAPPEGVDLTETVKSSASPHRRARTSLRTVKSSAFQRKNSYSCAPCSSRTAISRGKKRYWRPSASACLH